MGMVTAAELLQMAHSLARQQPPPGPAQPQVQLQPQSVRDGDEEGSSDDDTEAACFAGAAGAQHATGKRKRSHRGAGNKARRKGKHRRAQGRSGASDMQETGATQQADQADAI
jgi:hypothetical protein